MNNSPSPVTAAEKLGAFLSPLVRAFHVVAFLGLVVAVGAIAFSADEAKAWFGSKSTVESETAQMQDAIEDVEKKKSAIRELRLEEQKLESELRVKYTNLLSEHCDVIAAKIAEERVIQAPAYKTLCDADSPSVDAYIALRGDSSFLKASQ